MRPRSPRAGDEEPHKRARGNLGAFSDGLSVVLASGDAVALSPPLSPEEAVVDARRRVAAALSLDIERVMLASGKNVLQDACLVGDVCGFGAVTAVVLDDLWDTDDPQDVPEYATGIFRRLVEQDSQRALQPAAGALSDDSVAQRGQVVDWLVEVHDKFGMVTETLFLAVSIIDRFLKARPTVPRDLRLVGVSSMLIAAKFEEIYPPEIRDFVYSCNNEITLENIRSMEAFILSTLEFSISGQTAAHFMERCQRANNCSEQHGCLIQYILELALTDAAAARSAPCRLAAAATLLSNRLLEHQPTWPLAMVGYTGCAEEALAEPTEALHELLRAARQSPLQQVRRKFSRPEYFGAAQLAEEVL